MTNIIHGWMNDYVKFPDSHHFVREKYVGMSRFACLSWTLTGEISWSQMCAGKGWLNETFHGGWPFQNIGGSEHIFNQNLETLKVNGHEVNNMLIPWQQ